MPKTFKPGDRVARRGEDGSVQYGAAREIHGGEVLVAWDDGGEERVDGDALGLTVEEGEEPDSHVVRAARLFATALAEYGPMAMVEVDRGFDGEGEDFFALRWGERGVKSTFTHDDMLGLVALAMAFSDFVDDIEKSACLRAMALMLAEIINPEVAESMRAGEARSEAKAKKRLH